MTLREWIAEKGLTQREAAKLFNVHEISLNRWMSGRMLPRRPQIAIIEHVTEGRVRWTDWESPTVDDKPSHAAAPASATQVIC
jgi:transcriptional regulator with XRE-family HTH domain